MRNKLDPVNHRSYDLDKRKIFSIKHCNIFNLFAPLINISFTKKVCSNYVKNSPVCCNTTIFRFLFICFLSFTHVICKAQITIDSINTTISSCGNNGIASIFAKSKKSDPALMYELISGPSTTIIQNSPVFSSLSPGNYEVKIYDVDFNTKVEQFTITGNYLLPSLNPVGINPICPGFTNGQIKGNPDITKGRAPFTWEMISPVSSIPQLSDQFTNLTTGSYTIRMTDACGNFQTRTVILGTGSTGLSQWSNGVPVVSKVGCDSMILMHYFKISKEYAKISLTLTIESPVGVINKKVIPTPIDTINFFPGLYWIIDTIAGADYGQHLKVCLTDTCGVSICGATETISPFDFDLEYKVSGNCDNKMSAIVILKSYPWYSDYMYTDIMKPIKMTLTDIALNTVVDSMECTKDMACGLTLNEHEGGRNYKLQIIDGCGTVFEKDILWPIPDAPFIAFGSGAGCLDSTSIGYFQVFNFRSVATMEFLSGPTTLGSTKPGYKFSDKITYPKSFQIIPGGQFSIKNMVPGRYTYRCSDHCGNVITDSIEIYPFTVSNFKYSFSLKKGCAGDNILYFDGRSDNTAGLHIKDLSTGNYIYLNQNVWSNDSLTSLPPGKYGLEIYYGNYNLGGYFYNGSMSDKNNDCWAVYDTITIPAHNFNAVKSNVSIFCNGNTFVEINVDSTSGVPPYQYEITSGPKVFPLQTSNLFNVPTYGIYTIRVIDACGNSNSKQITVDSTKFLPIIKKGPSCLGGKVVLKGISSSFFSYEWKKPYGTVFTGDSLVIYPMTTADTGTYLITKNVHVNGCNDQFFSSYRLRLYDISENTHSICKGGFVKVGPKTYTLPGLYKDTLKNAFGCDSIIISRLIAVPQIYDTNRVAICSGEHFAIGSNNYNLPGIYIDSILNTGGCFDYTVTYLKVNGSKDTTHTSVCSGGSIKVGNNEYRTTGWYTDTFISHSGCDSIVVTDLKILPLKSNTLNKSICQGEHFTVGSHEYFQTGIYIDTITTSTCDSIVTLNLTVNAIRKDSLEKSICFGHVIKIGNHTYFKTGIYRDTIPSINCDSIIILNLTVQKEIREPFDDLSKEHCFEEGDLYVGPTWGKYFLWKNSGDTNQFIRITEGGIYTVTVTDEFGCSSTGDIFIKEYCIPKIFVPEAFSPNNDGLHDDLEIFGKYFTNFELKIFNRWGEIIFISNDRNKKWDGYYRNELMPIGSYPWIISYQSIFEEYGDKHVMTGSVTLVK
ncbi:gliding motility-associated C-terminal domain-containing protein [Sporocytophaga myxococcoides]|uniref:T9SS type B sorting domain-containing protein n=1 Tax=Sporocytophaga myxococcoides TaxID=153721 RepID=UPI0003FB5DE1|nr:gliding motility-associated C-terminal domain-containing protein [Sporocytophaga myxococcoides]